MQQLPVDMKNWLSGKGFAPERTTVGVALSGGRDSVALLDMCLASGICVKAVNVEHGIRGENSLKDSLFVKELCTRKGVELKSYSVDAPMRAKSMGETVEQAARALRYACFEDALDSGYCDVIATAHHLDDQAETVLMRILRGTGIKGLVGIEEVNGRYIRPLLRMSREQINAYVDERGLSYVEDETNLDEAYSRNFLREEIKRLKTRYPSMLYTISRLSDNAREAEEYIDEHLPEIEVKDGEAYIKTSDIGEKLIFKRAIAKGAKALGVTQDIESKHYDILISLAELKNGSRAYLTHGLVAHKEGEYIVLTRAESDENEMETPFGLGTLCGLEIELLGEGEEYSFDDGALYADYDAIPKGAVLRGRREGDRICKFGGGSKSLGDMLTDKKYPLRKRNALTVLAVGSEVLLVAGVDISSKLKITESTKRIVRVRVVK